MTEESKSTGPHIHADIEPGYQRVKIVEVKTGVGKIAMERQRQVIEKGYTLEHDLRHEPKRLLTAIEAFHMYAFERWRGQSHEEARAAGLIFWSPWDLDGFNPESVEDALVKAGAMTAALIDRETGTEFVVKPK